MIPWIKPKIWGNEREHLIKAFDSTWLSAGSYVDRLEDDFKKIHQSKHAITTCNGTASIFLILDALKIGHGDKVIVPAFAFGAAANIVSTIGAQPIFCEVDRKTYMLDPVHMESLLQKHKVKAVIPVHTYGGVCDMHAINVVAEKHGVVVIEDVAEAMFSKYDHKFAGTLGAVNSFSFQTTKTITTAEGGCILTESDELAFKMRTIRSHGMREKKYWHHERGNNFRLSNLLASLGAAQLEFWQENAKQRGVLYKKFLEKFGTIDGIELQTIDPKVTPVMWTFSIFIKPEFSKHTRDEIIEKLKQAGIETRPGFYTFNQMKMYDAPFLEVSDLLAAQVICLPFYLDLKDEEIDFIYLELIKLKS